MSNIKKYSYNKYSQNGEDGVLEYILSCIPNKDKICVEFGAWDGKYLSNTFKLVEDDGYISYYIEGDKEKYKDLLETSKIYSNIIPILSYVDTNGDNKLDNILLKNNLLKKDFDVLSIDVDGLDYNIWKNFVNYYPKIVIIEINSAIDPSIIYSPELLTDDKICNDGVNFMTMIELAKIKKYTFITHTGNCFFIRNDYSKYISDIQYDNIYSEFQTNWLR